MLLEWIHKHLLQRLIEKKQNVVRLRWQQAQLQKRLEQLKRQQKA